jgi:hypothetical protein
MKRAEKAKPARQSQRSATARQPADAIGHELTDVLNASDVLTLSVTVIRQARRQSNGIATKRSLRLLPSHHRKRAVQPVLVPVEEAEVAAGRAFETRLPR